MDPNHAVPVLVGEVDGVVRRHEVADTALHSSHLVGDCLLHEIRVGWGRDACVVDENVEPTMSFDRLVDLRVKGHRIAHVEDCRVATYLCGDLGRGIGGKVVDNDGGSVTCQSPSEGGAKTRTGAGDERDLARESAGRR